MSPKTKKKNLGQFFTSNVDYIFQGFKKFVKNKNVTDPFAGNGDLLRWANTHSAYSVQGFDVDETLKSKIVCINDSLLNPHNYDFVITNPPYLNVNKADQITKEKYFLSRKEKYEDLYHISLESILGSKEGIIVVPINFLSAENSRRIREIFFHKFEIVELNIFKNQVFDDTSYNVISFYYKQKKNVLKRANKVNATIFPEGKKIFFELRKENYWQFGGDFLKQIQGMKNYLGVKRLTREHIDNGKEEIMLAIQNPKNVTRLKVSTKTKKLLFNNIMVLKAIDSKNGERIKLDDIRNYKVSAIVGKNSSRNIAHLILDKNISITKQTELIKKFNTILNETRERYFSLFLTNFRDNGRKRISFDFSYKFLNYLYFKDKNRELINL